MLLGDASSVAWSTTSPQTTDEWTAWINAQIAAQKAAAQADLNSQYAAAQSTITSQAASLDSERNLISAEQSIYSSMLLGDKTVSHGTQAGVGIRDPLTGQTVQPDPAPTAKTTSPVGYILGAGAIYLLFFRKKR